METQYFLIGTDGRYYGPLSADDVRTWLADGRASRYSRARRHTEDQWMPLREMAEFEEETRPAYVGGAGPAVQSGVATREEQPGDAPAVRATLDPVSCFRRAWTLIMNDFAVLAAWTLASAMLIVGLSIIPSIGGLVAMPVNYLLQGALYVVFLSRMRGLRPSVNDVATTVGGAAVRLVAAGLVQAIITFPVVLATVSQSRTVAIALLAILLVPCIYLLVGYVFVLVLIVDRQLPVWTAMELSRRTVQRTWFQTFGLLVAAGMLIFVSAAALGVGLVLTLPLCTAVLMFAYEDLFGRQ